MPDDSALRTTLKALKDVADSDEARKPIEPQRTASPVASGGSSLLAELLEETSGEAQRELEQIKAQLADKKRVQEESRQARESERRAQLDELRAQERERRADMIRQREKGNRDETEEQVVAVEASRAAKAPAAGKSHGIAYALVALILLGCAGGGAYWYLQDQEAQRLAAVAKAEADARAEAERVAAVEAAAARADAERQAAATALAEKRAAAAVVAERVATRGGRLTLEPEADGYPRRMLELKAGSLQPAVAKGGKGKARGKAKAGGKRGKGKAGHKRIKIRALNLGGSK